MQILKQSTPFDPREYIFDKYYNQAKMKDMIQVKKKMDSSLSLR